jgi:methionyl-tRNA formyltransferase
LTARGEIQPTVLAAGFRGGLFVERLLAAGVHLKRVVSYKQAGDTSESFERLGQLANEHGLLFEEAQRPAIDDDALVFVIGWQFLLPGRLDRCVVMHDSLLPSMRGFAPTVSAILSGSECVGVTAIRPDQGVDTGPVYGARKIPIAAGASLLTIMNLQADAMVDLSLEIMRNATQDVWETRCQDEKNASYSIWRDGFDYFIDWRRSAPEILRQVRALGYPNSGAKAVLGDKVLNISNATEGPDISFVLRDPGKLWSIADRRALVVCGAGTVWIEEASLAAGGDAFRFTRLRSRFLTADNAWLAPFVAKTT